MLSPRLAVGSPARHTSRRQTLLIKPVSVLLDNSEQRELAWQDLHGPEGERSSKTRSERRDGPSRSQAPRRGIIPGSDPASPGSRSLPRLVGQSTKDTIARVQFQGKCRTSARAELTQSSDNSRRARQIGRRPARKPGYCGATGQIAAHRRLLSAHVGATTPPKRDWSLPSRGVICAGAVRGPTFPCREASQVRPPQQRMQLDN